MLLINYYFKYTILIIVYLQDNRNIFIIKKLFAKSWNSLLLL